ncbi:TetR/AcrR family transcriptional regulator [Streptomyces sp. NPDC058953]|uniref:TetR/AcrR family transcriptional regulator n=1 Tax=unclassified Streptomyces TaxID=2593676 RepID=UPI0036A46551
MVGAGVDGGGAKGRRIRGLDAGERRARRRDDLLDAALDLFSAQGYQDTSIEQICKHAYVGTKSFYEVFTGKEALYLALLDRIVADVTGRLASALDALEEGGDEREAARSLLRLFADAFVDDVRVARVTFGEGRAVTPLAEMRRRSNRRMAASFVEAVWSRLGMATGPRTRAVAMGLIGGLFDIIADWLLDADGDGGVGVGVGDAARPADRGALEEGLDRFYTVVSAGLTAP